MTEDTIGIGDLARLTGVPVRTIRFYCDEGLLHPQRTAGNHRRFPRTAVDRLTQLRQLRAVGLNLTAITEVLDGTRSLPETLTTERATLSRDLAALSWRHATLTALSEATPESRAARLALLSAAADGPTAHGALTTFWRTIFIAPARQTTVDMYLHAAAPTPPPHPTPAQVLAYAEMVTLLSNPALHREMLRRAHLNRPHIPDEDALHEAVGTACQAARPHVLAHHHPGPSPALEAYVQAHAAIRRVPDTPRFRRQLAKATSIDRHPSLRRYWQLVGTITGEDVPVGQAHTWLLDALAVTHGPRAGDPMTSAAR